MRSENLNNTIEEIITKLSGLSPKEILGYAIEMEKQEAEHYSALASIATRLSLRALFLRLSDECREHEKALRGLFSKLYPGETPPAVDVPSMEIFELPERMESPGENLEVLTCCMTSELLTKRVYEELSRRTENEEVRKLANALAKLEEEHYTELRRVYELIRELERKGITPETLSPGAYLFTDYMKARYFLLDFLGWHRKLFALIRLNPAEFTDMFAGRIERAYIVSPGAPGAPVSPVRVGEVPSIKHEVSRFFRRFGDRGVMLVENFEYLVTALGLKEAMDFMLLVKDTTLLAGGYLLVTAVKEAFSENEWALLTSELELIS